jgi:hypothetical protein
MHGGYAVGPGWRGVAAVPSVLFCLFASRFAKMQTVVTTLIGSAKQGLTIIFLLKPDKNADVGASTSLMSFRLQVVFCVVYNGNSQLSTFFPKRTLIVAGGTLQSHKYTTLTMQSSPAVRPRSVIPRWSLYLVAFCLMATPVAAQPDRDLSGCYESIITFLTALILTLYNLIAFSGTLIGPCMGISSVLWLVMRNDAAIEPKWSWM